MSKEKDLFEVIRRPNEEAFKRLIKEADLDYRDEEGQTATHLAATFGNLDYLIDLLNAGAPVDAVDRYDATPLYRAIETILCDGLVFGEGFRAVIRELIYRGADTTILNHEDLDALTLTNDGAPDEYAQLALEAIREFVTTVTVEDEGAATAGGGRRGRAVERRSRGDIPASSRRLDSLARLITGESVCAAVAFTGDRLLIANNKGEINDTTEVVIGFLSKVATRESSIEELSADKGLLAEMEEIARIAATNFAAGKKPRRGKKPNDIIAAIKPRMLQDLKKLVSSLAREDGKTQNIFLPILKDIFKRQGAEFVSGGKDKDKKSLRVHAEMAILDEIIRKDGLEVADGEVMAGTKPLYIGITMLCCKDCHHAVTALNEVEVDKRRSGIEEVVDAVDVRGEHLHEYPWAEPAFFSVLRDVKEKYESIKREEVIYRSGVVLADDSSSEPQIDIATRMIEGGGEAVVAGGGIGSLSPGSTPLSAEKRSMASAKARE